MRAHTGNTSPIFLKPTVERQERESGSEEYDVANSVCVCVREIDRGGEIVRERERQGRSKEKEDEEEKGDEEERGKDE